MAPAWQVRRLEVFVGLAVVHLLLVLLDEAKGTHGTGCQWQQVCKDVVFIVPLSRSCHAGKHLLYLRECLQGQNSIPDALALFSADSDHTCQEVVMAGKDVLKWKGENRARCR